MPEAMQLVVPDYLWERVVRAVEYSIDCRVYRGPEFEDDLPTYFIAAYGEPERGNASNG